MKIKYHGFTDRAWEDYIYWQSQDKKNLKRINMLIYDIMRNGNEGVGKPEPLHGDLTDLWSRRINDKERLVYTIINEELVIVACRRHYDDIK